MKTLIMNRHALTWATGERGKYVPARPDERFLITRTFGDGITGYDATAFPNVAVVDTYYPDRLEATARWLIEAYRISRVVAIHEKDMILAAELRESYGLPGMDVESTLRFRDKVLMKDVLAAKGYDALPRYRALGYQETVAAVPWAGRTVVKSRWGVGASEVRVARDLAEANRAARELERGPDQLEIEEFVDGKMYHCDSVVIDGGVAFTAVSEYIAQPGHFGEGKVAGSVLLLAGPLREELLAENTRVLELLGMGSGVTHVEFFRRPSGELVFCEAAARPGGGGINDIIAEAYRVDIIRAAVELQAGVTPDLSGCVDQPERVVGVIGVYHSAGGDDHPVAGLKERFPGVRSYTFAHQEMPGRVRHCTDYAHKIVLAAPDRARFDSDAALVIETIRANDQAPADTGKRSDAS